MKNYVRDSMLLCAVLILSRSCYVHTSPITIKAVSQFDDVVTNPAKPVAVVFAYVQSKETEKSVKKQLEKARKGFSELTKQKLYKRADVQFVVVNAMEFSGLQKEFGIPALQDDVVYFVIYYKGNILGTQKVILLPEDDVKELITERGQDIIEAKAGDILDDIIQDKKDKEWELEKMRAQAPVYYSPFYYDPWWGYYGGCGYRCGYRWGYGYWW